MQQGIIQSSLQEPRVVILDFGAARKSQSVDEEQAEEEQLCSMLCGHSGHTSDDDHHE
jgi:hypothetical protein